jgi:predicted dehydrogenase
MYRFHRQTRDVLRLVSEGAIGDLVHIDGGSDANSACRPPRSRWPSS